MNKPIEQKNTAVDSADQAQKPVPSNGTPTFTSFETKPKVPEAVNPDLPKDAIKEPSKPVPVDEAPKTPPVADKVKDDAKIEPKEEEVA